jgi:hypothetical protein
MRQILYILILFGLFACNTSQNKKQSDKRNITIDDRVLYPKTNLSILFDSLRPAIQTYTIKGDRDTLLVGQNGTTLTILKNTFVNSQGQLAKKVSIDLVEINTISDIINANLQTTSGDKILQTGGMFFIDAKENNKSLAVAEGKLVYVEVSSNYKDTQMKIFDGKFDDNGKIDWIKSGKLENNLIPIPLNFLNFRIGGWECSLSEKQIKSITTSEIENTYIATREFEQRAIVLNFASCEQYNALSQKLLKIYTANIKKPLFYSDSLAADYILKNYKEQIDTNRKFDFDEVGWITSFYQAFTAFSKERLTNVINFDNLGITESTTMEELHAKGYSESDAEKYIAFFKQREQIIKSRESEKQTSRLASYSFSITKLGWVNVDRFIDDKNTESSTFLVQIKSKDTLDFISVSLVIPSYSVAVFSIHNDGNLFSFTKKNDGYRTLPVGEDAIIVAFSYKDNKPYFGKQKIKIPKDGQIDLALTTSTENAIKQNINKLTE